MSSAPIVPTVTPPQGSFTQGDQPSISGQPTAQGNPDQLMQIIQKMLASSQRPTLGQPVPAPLPPQAQTMQAPQGRWQNSGGAGQLMQGLTSGIQNAWAFHKQKQMAEAVSDWNDLGTALQKYMQPDGTINPQAYTDPAVMNVLGEPKKLKKMAESLNQDWMNPDKTTVHGEAYKVWLKQQQQKQQAAQGIKGLVSKLLQRNQAQMSPQDQQGMAQQVMSKAPVSGANSSENLKTVMPLLTEAMRNEQADKTQAAETQRAKDAQAAEDKRAKDAQAAEDKRAALVQESESERSAAVQKAEDSRAAAERQTQVQLEQMRVNAENLRAGNTKASQLNSQLNATLGSLKAQSSQLGANVRNLQNQKTKLQTQAAEHYIMGPGKSEIDAMQKQIDDAQAKGASIDKAIATFNAQKGIILKMAKTDPDKAADMMDALTQQANDIALGNVSSTPRAGVYNPQTGQVEWSGGSPTPRGNP